MRNLLDFENTEVAFSLKSNKELKKAKCLFTIIGIEWFARIAKPVTNFFLKIRLPIKSMLKQTVFNQFCGGETIAECKPTITSLYETGGVYSILDYSVEGKESEVQFDNTLAIILNACEYAQQTNATPFLVFKGTGLGKFELFKKASKNEPLSVDEQKLWDKTLERFDTICTTVAQTENIKVMIDAEETWIQEAIDALAEKMMAKYNSKRTVVFNTVQLYRWDRLDYLDQLFINATEHDFKVGVKLVRGAYMEKERERAKKKGYISPICVNKEATDENFNNGIYFCLQNLGMFEIFLGTHNEVSSKLLLEIMNNADLHNDDQRIWFGQLFGMSDHISFNMAKEGYNTAKYLPFGPVKEVIPYLLRRAEENTSVGTQTSRELFLINQEIARRKAIL